LLHQRRYTNEDIPTAFQQFANNKEESIIALERQTILSLLERENRGREHRQHFFFIRPKKPVRESAKSKQLPDLTGSPTLSRKPFKHGPQIPLQRNFEQEESSP